ncbi:DUF1697 domain-containing protein [Propionibacteriaceae bacterium Y2011]|uniref:DUF1697 domain-containing protein n=1 Tax=Microlunatus sp. Y2014 TaxID=3418488 RepID=UPI003B483440
MDYALFLRGINVGGVRMAMPELREVLDRAGLAEVRTYLNTGNVTFGSTKSVVQVERLVATTLADAFDYTAALYLLPHDRLAVVVAGYPFDTDDDHHRYAIFCDDADTVTELAAAAGGQDEVAAGDGVVYWKCPKGQTLKTPFSTVLTKPRFRASTTNRNLNTVEKML